MTIRNAKAQEELPGSGKRLLVINTLFAGASALSNTFLNIYLWKLLRDLDQIAIYNFFIFFFTAVGYATAGWIAKRTDRLYTLRIGIGILALFYVLILVLGARVDGLQAMLGCLLGFGNGFYWLSYNILVFEVTEPETRDRFNGLNGFLLATASGVAPMLAAQILARIPWGGYQILFLLSFGLFLLAVFVTWRMRHRESPAFYDLYVGFRPEEHGKLWRQVLLGSLFLGLREGTVSFLPFLLVFLVTKNELLAGRYLLLISACSLLAFYIVKRFLTHARRGTFVIVAGLALGSSVLLLLLKVTTVSLFVFGIFNALFAPLLLIPNSCLALDVMGRLPEAVHRKVEYLVIREVALNIGRCLSLLVLILCEFWWPDAISIRVAFLLIGISPLTGLLFYRRSARDFEQAAKKIGK
ncbi:MAG: MFS transporter [Tumebacillaceae bacterium]